MIPLMTLFCLGLGVSTRTQAQADPLAGQSTGTAWSWWSQASTVNCHFQSCRALLWLWRGPSPSCVAHGGDLAGVTRRPSLLSPQGTIVTRGQTLTLQCHSEVAYDILALSKKGHLDLCQVPSCHTQSGSSQANFTMVSVSIYHGGQYHCYGGHGVPPLWSEPSDPLDILVAGQFSYTPTLSVEPGPSVSPGDNVTLRCQSRDWKNTFLLAKEGTVDLPLRIKVNKTEKITEALFSFHPVTLEHNGTYRCYSSNSSHPYWLSHPSAPLQIWVSGPSGDSRTDSRTMSTTDVGECPHSLPGPSGKSRTMSTADVGPPGDSRTMSTADVSESPHSLPRPSGDSRTMSTADVEETQNLNNSDQLIIGLSTTSALLVLLLLIFLLLLFHYRHSQTGHRKSYAAVTHTQSEEGVLLNPQSRQNEDPHRTTYAQVKHAGLRQGVASCPPISGAQLNA